MALKLSIVSTLYRSQDYVEEFCLRAAKAAEEFAGQNYEIVLVDDGSPDGSLDAAKKAHAVNDRVRIVELSRNFGHHKAMMTGLAFARGENVFLIDSDLEEAPEWLLQFAEQLEQTDCDVVYGVQEKRRGGFAERLSGLLFYRLVPALSGVDIPENSVTARLMRRPYVDALVRHDERQMFIAGLWHLTGFRQQPSSVTKLDTSPTSYSFGRKLHMLVTAITSHSSGPLLMMFYVGLLIFAGACTYTLYVVLDRLFFGDILPGWTSIVASIWLLGGILVSFIGILGIYLSNIYMETKRRPYVIIRQVIEGTEIKGEEASWSRSSIDEIQLGSHLKPDE